jgi:hypothetical protein
MRRSGKRRVLVGRIQAHQQAVYSRMPPSALLCCSGQRAEVADEVKVGAVIKRLEAVGWFLAATRGSHCQVQASDPVRKGYGGWKAQ